MQLKHAFAASLVLAMAIAVPQQMAVAAGPAPAGGAAAGATLFAQRCQSCHTATAGQRAVLAPNLAGVVGRKAASTTFNYSPALKASNLTWTRANLDRFLTSPMRMVPGTRMVIAIPDAQQRAAVLDYLATRR